MTLTTKQMLNVASLVELILLFALLRYGSVHHKQWPSWAAMAVAAIALVHLGCEQVSKHRGHPHNKSLPTNN
jgi:hypothetical protein